MEPTKTTFKHPGDLDSEIWEWLKEHGTEETKQVIMMTARHFAGFIVASKQEQPSLPSNLDEVAWEYFVKTYGIDNIAISKDIKRAVKFGAKWIAEQGVTKEAVIGMATEEISINVSEQTLNELELCPGDKVIVQIRKK